MAMIISSARAAPADTASKKEKATQQIREIDTTTTPNNQRIKVVTQFHQILSLVLLQYRKLYPERTNPSSLTENSCHTRALLALQATIEPLSRKNPGQRMAAPAWPALLRCKKSIRRWQIDPGQKWKSGQGLALT
ncbi:hypothetical protein [Roseibium aggregatum]|uniref:hypothetical protein n=1 Tax=Roseibium aggregatum TaxID=187304 RepID=UPI001E3CDED9|nr:hypothetical protein [Roseibium aggregatum]